MKSAFKFKINDYESLFSYDDLNLCAYAADQMIRYRLKEDASYVITDEDRKTFDVVIFQVYVHRKSTRIQK